MNGSSPAIEGDDAKVPGLTGQRVGRYAIQARLGAGGMGEVYSALDTQLHRQVALKRVGPRYRSDPQYRRYLLNEARRASALSDPRVAAVYDVFEHDEELFVVMEYLDGLTLRKRMEQPLSSAEFHHIATQCARGLAAAHEKGIVHGDLKPENIMVSSKTGDIKICDFGLARRTPSAPSESQTTSQPTTTVLLEGTAIAGTPAYMAPETLAGEPATARSDIFALGVTFYEMLSGRNPFQAENLAATAQRIVAATPARLDSLNRGIPVGMSAIVSRMLEKAPDSRFENAGELLAALEGVPAAPTRQARIRWKPALVPLVALVCLVIALVGVFWSGFFVGQKPAVLVILPFETVESTPAQHIRSDGLSETLNAALVKVSVGHNLHVMPERDVRQQNVKTPEDARAELGATLVLKGTVQYSGNLVRVACLLVDPRTKAQLDGDTVTVEDNNPFLLQDRIAEAAVKMLGIRLSPDEQVALQEHGTRKPGANELYVEGRGYLSNFDREGNLDSAIDLFGSALQIDPDYVLAHAGLGEARWRKFETSKDVSLVEPARAACQKAVSLGPEVAEAHLCLGTIYNGTFQYEKAVAEFSRSIELEPALDIAYLNLGTAYKGLGKNPEAEKTLLRAVDMKPGYWAAHSALGKFYSDTGNFERAREQYSQVVILAPDSYRGYSNLGVMLHALGHTGEAIKALEKSLSIRPSYYAASNLAGIRFRQGDYTKAAALLRKALSISDKDYRVWTNLASSLHWAGREAEAVEAYKESRGRIEEYLRVNPRDALARMHLAECNAALGSEDLALSEVQEALKQKPDDRELLFTASIIYEYRLKRRDDALMFLRKAIERGYSWEDVNRSPALTELRKDLRFSQLRNSR